jgi:hypothetical protein
MEVDMNLLINILCSILGDYARAERAAVAMAWWMGATDALRKALYFADGEIGENLFRSYAEDALELADDEFGKGWQFIRRETAPEHVFRMGDFGCASHESAEWAGNSFGYRFGIKCPDVRVHGDTVRYYIIPGHLVPEVRRFIRHYNTLAGCDHQVSRSRG